MDDIEIFRDFYGSILDISDHVIVPCRGRKDKLIVGKITMLKYENGIPYVGAICDGDAEDELSIQVLRQSKDVIKMSGEQYTKYLLQK